jgi:hypothetical protein
VRRNARSPHGWTWIWGNWFRFKNGQDMGVVFLGAVVRAYPELQLLVIEYIRSRPRRAQKPPATLSA